MNWRTEKTEADATVRKELMRVGFWITMGAGQGLAWFILGAMALGWCVDRTPWAPHDSTDDAPGHHSGMIVHTDHLTGCQYLSDGSLTPRLGKDGRQVCSGAQ